MKRMFKSREREDKKSHARTDFFFIIGHILLSKICRAKKGPMTKSLNTSSLLRLSFWCAAKKFAKRCERESGKFHGVMEEKFATNSNWF